MLLLYSQRERVFCDSRGVETLLLAQERSSPGADNHNCNIGRFGEMQSFGYLRLIVTPFVTTFCVVDLDSDGGSSSNTFQRTDPGRWGNRVITVLGEQLVSKSLDQSGLNMPKNSH